MLRYSMLRHVQCELDKIIFDHPFVRSEKPILPSRPAIILCRKRESGGQESPLAGSRQGLFLTAARAAADLAQHRDVHGSAAAAQHHRNRSLAGPTWRFSDPSDAHREDDRRGARALPDRRL